MPLTDKGRKVLRNMKTEYGARRGEQVFYASINAGKLKEVEGRSGAHKSKSRKKK